MIVLHRNVYVILKVLCAWEKKTAGATTEILITYLAEWCRKGYVMSDVWGKIKDLIAFNLPAHVQVENTCGTNVADATAGSPSVESK